MAAKMRIEYLPISDIKPYENNPRRNQKAVEAVANSIREFGFKNPIIVDSNNVIISGHTRRLAALRLGLEKVPVYRATDMSEAQAKAFRLADNRVAEMAEWDKDKLKEEIAAIKTISLEDFGFSESLLNDVAQEQTGVKVHVCPRCGAEWTEKA